MSEIDVYVERLKRIMNITDPVDARHLDVEISRMLGEAGGDDKLRRMVHCLEAPVWNPGEEK